MVEDLYLHIGHPKTGTGSIQQTFRQNAALLEENGIHYPAAEWNHRLIAVVAPGSAREAASAMRFREELERGLARTRAPAALVSAETLIRLRRADARTLVARLRAHARRVTVVLYVRHPVSVANSFAHEGVRVGKPLAQVVERPRVLPLRRLVERWEWASGGRIVVRPFAAGLLAGGDAIDDLLAVMGRPEIGPSLSRVRINGPLSALGIALLDRAHRQGRLPRGATRLFEKVGGPRYVLPAGTLDRVCRQSATDLAYLSRRFGLDLPEPNEVPTPPPPFGEATLGLLATAFRTAALWQFRRQRAAANRQRGATAGRERPSSLPVRAG